MPKAAKHLQNTCQRHVPHDASSVCESETKTAIEGLPAVSFCFCLTARDKPQQRQQQQQTAAAIEWVV